MRLGRRIELGCPEMIKAVVAAGLGFSYLTAKALDAEPKDPRIKPLRLAGLTVSRTITVVRHKHKYNSPAMEAFFRLVGDVVRQ